MLLNTWPIGTCHFSDLPAGIQLAFAPHIVDGVVSPAFEVHQTATEGAYVDFSGWKVRVNVEVITVGPQVAYVARLA